MSSLEEALAPFLPAPGSCDVCCAEGTGPQDPTFGICTSCQLRVCPSCRDPTAGTCVTCRGVWYPGYELHTPRTQRVFVTQRTRASSEELFATARSRPPAQPTPPTWVPVAADPQYPSLTFCPHRDAMLSGVGYDGTDDRLVIAVDLCGPGHAGAKAYNVVQRSRVRDFVLATAPSRRHYYVMADPALPCDLCIDVDLNLCQSPSMVGKGPSLLAGVLRTIDGALQFLCGTSIGSLVVLDGSRADKISYHVHIRAASGAAFPCVAAMKRFVNWAKENRPDDVPLETVYLIDNNGYNRWQPFRLPYCTKQGSSSSSVPFTFTDLTADPALAPWAPRVVADDVAAFDICLITRAVGDRTAHLASTIVPLGAAALAGEDSNYWTQFVNVVPHSVEHDTVLRLFQSLSPNFAGLTDVMVTHNVGNPRYYVVKQHQCSWCLFLNRNHKSTHGVLHIYYQRCYYRCWSNDCTHRGMKPLGDTPVAARDVLFPPLSEEELVMRGYAPQEPETME